VLTTKSLSKEILYFDFNI